MKENNSVSYQDVADFFLAIANERGETITNLRLQKLVYYAQAWFLANTGKPLFEEDFEAWVHGPVLPVLYDKYKELGPKPIVTELKFPDVEKRFGKSELEILNAVADVYMQYGAYQMELMTHNEEPWIKARQGIEPDARSNNKIDKALMMEFYGERLRKPA